MEEIQNSKRFDLEERTFEFARRCRELVKMLPKTLTNLEDGKQLTRSSGSVHANYIEANESLSRKDFYHRARICRKEAKESRSWLRLIDLSNAGQLESERNALIQESTELMRILGSMISKEEQSR